MTPSSWWRLRRHAERSAHPSCTPTCRPWEPSPDWSRPSRSSTPSTTSRLVSPSCATRQPDHLPPQRRRHCGLGGGRRVDRRLSRAGPASSPTECRAKSSRKPPPRHGGARHRPATPLVVHVGNIRPHKGHANLVDRRRVAGAPGRPSSGGVDRRREERRRPRRVRALAADAGVAEHLSVPRQAGGCACLRRRLRRVRQSVRLRGSAGSRARGDGARTYRGRHRRRRRAGHRPGRRHGSPRAGQESIGTRRRYRGTARRIATVPRHSPLRAARWSNATTAWKRWCVRSNPSTGRCSMAERTITVRPYVDNDLDGRARPAPRRARRDAAPAPHAGAVRVEAHRQPFRPVDHAGRREAQDVSPA